MSLKLLAERVFVCGVNLEVIEDEVCCAASFAWQLVSAKSTRAIKLTKERVLWMWHIMSWVGSMRWLVFCYVSPYCLCS